jgi:redox-sensitive bicupin YhaK (pirin superfamily)
MRQPPRAVRCKEARFSYTAAMSTPNPIKPHTKDLGGGFVVRRLLPAAARQAVGPFLFFDHFGPITAAPTDNHDVRAHPHIGLATVTYLFEGAMMHRDSTGAVQRIEPGAINWMTAGRGIVHSERTPDDLRGHERRSHGLQLWAALPEADEAMPPSFAHTPAAALPELEVGGAVVRVLIGSAFGAASPVAVRSPTLYLDIALQAGDALPLPLASERAIYVVEGPVSLDGEPLPPQTMTLLAAGDEPLLAADGSARVVLIGGDALGRRHLWWNFVATSRERLAEAAAEWADGPGAAGDADARFPQVPGETEFIPAPPFRPA